MTTMLPSPVSSTPSAQALATFLAYFEAWRANNGGTEAVNGLIEDSATPARSKKSRITGGRLAASAHQCAEPVSRKP